MPEGGMRPTAVVFCIMAAFGMLVSAATGGTAEIRLGDIKLPPGFRIAPYAEVLLEGNRAASYEVFAYGWLQGGRAWGRPVDVQEMPDGSLLVSDDMAGRIYRISWSGE